MNNTFSLDLALIPKELKLLLEIMKMENEDGVQLDKNELFRDIDWNKFLELAIHHRVHSFIYPKVKKVDEKLIPPHVGQRLLQLYRRNTFQMLQLSGEMEQVSKLFIENQIRPLFLKGPVLAADLYGDISLRTSRDLDVIIPANDLEKAEELLVNFGYVKDDYFSTVLNDWKWRHHHLTYFHPEKRITVEIHWRLNPGPGKEPRFNDLWERKRISTITSYPVYFLGREDLFLFLVSHGARHGWSRLRWLVDIHQIVNQRIEWRKLKILLKKFQYLHLGGQALILASELLNTSISEEMRALTAGYRPRRSAQDAVFYMEQMVNLHTDPLPEDVARYHKRHLFSLKSNQQKFFFIMSFLYPYSMDVKTLPLPKNLHFLYFPLRPVLWIWRKTRNHALLP